MTTRRLLGKHDAYAAAAAAAQRAAAAADRGAADRDLRLGGGAERIQVDARGASPRRSQARYQRLLATFRCTRRRSTPISRPGGLYRYFFDIFGMMLIGMALFRLGVLTLRAAGAALLGDDGRRLCGRARRQRRSRRAGSSTTSSARSPSPRRNISYDLGRLAMTIGHLGALLLFVRSGALGWLRRAFAAVGQMAVTNYLMHSVVCADPVHRPRMVQPARAAPALLCRVRDLGGAARRSARSGSGISASARSNGCGAASPI